MQLKQGFIDLSNCRNVADLWLTRLKATPAAKAVSYETNPGRTETTEWTTLTWEEYGMRIRCVAAGLLSLGLKKGHRIALYAQTNFQWALVDAAALSVGAVVMPIYEAAPLKDLISLIRSTQATFLVIGDQGTWEKILTSIQELPDLQRVITLVPVAGDADMQIDLTELEARGKQGLERAQMLGPNATEGDLLKHAADSVEPSREACIYHTSGTQGDPQPVPITHAMLISEIRQVQTVFSPFFTSEETGLTMLPYSHIFGRVEWLCHLAFGGHGYVAGGIHNLPNQLKQVGPSVFFTVPRVLEKIRQRIYHQIYELSGLRRALAEKALQTFQGAEEGGGIAARLADRLVVGKIRDGLGGKLHTIITAGAALHPDLARFFSLLGIRVLEAYGLTETTGAVAVSDGEAANFGTVGKSLPDVNVKLSGDGEILLNGPNVFPGYGLSVSQAKSDVAFETIDGKPWFKTGDWGEWDASGNLKILGRKKDILVNTAGKNIAPQRIESIFSADTVFDQVVILGDNRPFVVGLIVLNREIITDMLQRTDLLETEEWYRDPAVIELVKKHVSLVNQKLAPFEIVKNFAILTQPFSQERGELTLSQKPRRSRIIERYRDLIESLYRNSG